MSMSLSYLPYFTFPTLPSPTKPTYLDDQGGEDPSPSKKGSTSYVEQKRRAGQWAADNLKGPSGKKEKAKVRSRCLRLIFPFLTFPTLPYLTLPHFSLPYITSSYFTLPCLTLDYLAVALHSYHLLILIIDETFDT